MFEFSILINSFFLLFSILVIAAVSSYVSERVGITNLGLDGMMCMGALFFGIYSSPVLKMSTISF
jgi:simple sugar transport system permease protein